MNDQKSLRLCIQYEHCDNSKELKECIKSVGSYEPEFLPDHNRKYDPFSLTIDNNSHGGIITFPLSTNSVHFSILYELLESGIRVKGNKNFSNTMLEFFTGSLAKFLKSEYYLKNFHPKISGLSSGVNFSFTEHMK